MSQHMLGTVKQLIRPSTTPDLPVVQSGRNAGQQRVQPFAASASISIVHCPGVPLDVDPVLCEVLHAAAVSAAVKASDRNTSSLNHSLKAWPTTFPSPACTPS